MESIAQGFSGSWGAISAEVLTVVGAALGLAAVWVLKRVSTYLDALKAKLEADTAISETVHDRQVVSMLVDAAEQKWAPGANDAKREWVIEQAVAQGIQAKIAAAALEAAVRQLK